MLVNMPLCGHAFIERRAIFADSASLKSCLITLTETHLTSLRLRTIASTITAYLPRSISRSPHRCREAEQLTHAAISASALNAISIT